MSRTRKFAGFPISITGNYTRFTFLTTLNNQPIISTDAKVPPLWVASVPVVALLGALIVVIVALGPDAVSEWSIYIMAGAGLLAAAMSLIIYKVRRSSLLAGLRRSFKQMLPCYPLLLMIATVSTSWMLSGVVPYLVERGIMLLNPIFFLALACFACAVVSSLTGSSWTTIATVGVAFMGVGAAFGYSMPWTAGAIISGAYFGDKCSPLSDTTVIASTSTGVEIFTLIRYMARTTLPAFSLALIVFAVMGLGHDGTLDSESMAMVSAMGRTFNLTPWVLVVPATTVLLIALRRSTLVTLAGSAIAGFIGMFVFQPGVLQALNIDSFTTAASAVGTVFMTGVDIDTGTAALNDLVQTGGLVGIFPTVLLISAAVIFGGSMMGSGFLDRITGAMAARLSRRPAIVSSTVGTCVLLNALTADQYISIIISANVYKNVYVRSGLSMRLLGRSLQDAVVTSVLFPWSSCGVTQTAVLGVPTLAYMPFCLFNIFSPISAYVSATITYRRQKRRLNNPQTDSATAK